MLFSNNTRYHSLQILLNIYAELFSVDNVYKMYFIAETI